MEMNKIISIIIPVYNVERYLETCMESILKQTYKNIEIILVDDGSTDFSGKMCDHYAEIDKRVKVIHKENGGLSDARNKGILQASGEYIMFVDSDDMVSYDFVEYLLNLLKDNSADIAICDPVHCHPDKKCYFEEETFRKVFEPEEAIVEMLYQKSFLVAAWGKLYKRECFNDISFPYGMLFEDSAIMYKVFDKTKKIVYGNAKLYGYMHREGSITTKSFSKKDCDILIICNQLSEYMSVRSEKLQNASRSYQAAAAFRIYMNAPRNGMFKSEIKESKLLLKSNWKFLMRDSYIRKKMKVALFMYKFARPIMPIVYKKINRWK